MKAQSSRYKQYEARHIEEILDISRNRIFFWVKTYRFVKPAWGEASGTGTRSKYSENNLLELSIVKEMVNFGLDLSTIKKIKNSLDGMKVIGIQEEGKWKHIDLDEFDDLNKKGIQTKKINYYKWAFMDAPALFLRIVKESDGSYWVSYFEERKDKKSEEDPFEVMKYVSVLIINVSLLAQQIRKKTEGI